MNTNILQLQPTQVWKYFTALNQVPRPSKKEEKVIQFMIDFGEGLSLNTQKDQVGNVLIKKPATQGMENKKTIVMQSHLDMVCQKNNDVNFNFDTQGINMYIENGFVKAKGTTLGADNGMGVAAIMAVLASDTISHPAIEALFTIDEETGMTGAKELQPDLLSGSILLNLDTEEDDEIDIGCAGGVDITGTLNYTPQTTTSKHTTFLLSINGLKGGHSGIDIHKGRGNANKLLARFLGELNSCIMLNSIDGGGLRNAIPREAQAYFSCTENNIEIITNAFNSLKKDIIEEFKTIEKKLQITLTKTTQKENQLPKDIQTSLIKTLVALQNGVFRWSPDINDLVETSNNVARVDVKNGNITLMCLCRSSVESTKKEMAESLKSVLELGGCKVEFSGDYPGWKPNPNSQILTIMEGLYTQLFNKKPKVVACHAGLECGLIGNKYPTMDMVSFGPNIFGAHSPDERVEIQSVKKFWQYLLTILEHIPEKDA